MDIKLFFLVFGSVFIAELGDKTQVATLLFAAKSPSYQQLLTVFTASALALMIASGLGVVAGQFLAKCISPQALARFAGAAFILIGAWTLYRA